MVPPLIKCDGIQTPSARASNGVYEFQGTVGGRPCYHQVGISSGNHLWYAEEGYHGPMWVITPKTAGVGGCPSALIAACKSSSRWPWETEGWLVCSATGSELVPSPGLRMSILNPVGELEVKRTAGQKEEVARYRCCGDIHGRPAYKRIDRPDGRDERLFWLASQRGPALLPSGRWTLVVLKEDGGGIDNVIARSHADDGASWASLWPWCAEKGGWECADKETWGLILGDAAFVPDKDLTVRMVSPSINFSGVDSAPTDVRGIYQARGMLNGRAYYMLQMENAMSDSAAALAIWFAEDRGQWVLTESNQIGDSTQVLARIASRAWWPWEAHLTSNSSPGLMGASMLAAMPEWHHGAAMLASLRASWEMSDARGKFHAMKTMAAELIHEQALVISAGEGAEHPFIGNYRYAGLLSSRPYFLQRRKSVKKKARYAIWYAEDDEKWIITNDYRLLDGTTADARIGDSAWLPWEVVGPWEVADGQGGFVNDILLRVVVSDAPALDVTLLPSSGSKSQNLEPEPSGSEPEDEGLAAV